MDTNSLRKLIKKIILIVVYLLYLSIMTVRIMESLKTSSNIYSIEIFLELLMEIFAIPYLFSILTTFLHEYIHSLMSRLILKDWGEVSFSLERGYFYTSKPMNVNQYTIIAVAPLLVEVSSLYLAMSFLGSKFGIFNFHLLILASIRGCVSDIAGILSYNLTRKQNKVIYLPFPSKKVRRVDSCQKLNNA